MGRHYNPVRGEGPARGFAKRLRLMTEDKPLREVAELTNVSIATLSKALSGLDVPSPNTVYRIAKAFGQDPSVWEAWRRAADGAGKSQGTKHVDDIVDIHGSRSRRAMRLPSPVPDVKTTIPEFKALLREIRIWAGSPPLRQIEFRAARRKYVAPRATVHDMLHDDSNKLPRADLLIGYLAALGVEPYRLDIWFATWQRLWPMQQKRYTFVPPQPRSA